MDLDEFVSDTVRILPKLTKKGEVNKETDWELLCHSDSIAKIYLFKS